MSPTAYPDLNDVLRQLIEGVQTVLRANFHAACLQGSFAIGNFDEHSDVDFVVAVEAPLSPVEVEGLQSLHGRVYALESPWAKHLEGSYFPKEVLRRPPVRGERLWYLDHGASSLIQSDHCNTLVVRSTVRDHGVRLAGPEPRTLLDPIPVDTLRAEMLGVMRDWGAELLAEPEKINSRWYQGFAVLSYCRMLHEYRMGRVASKRAGAEWAKANLDPEWADFIDRAWLTRPDPARSSREPADPVDLRRTVKFIRYVIGLVDEVPG